MLYELMGRGHAAASHRLPLAWREHRARGERGQGTVEYVGLILLIAVVLAGVVHASGGLGDQSIAKAVIAKLKAAIDGVGSGGTPGGES